MTRPFPPNWSDLMARERASLARAESVVDQDRDEARSAARFDTGSYKRVGGALMDVYDVPDEGDL